METRMIFIPSPTELRKRPGLPQSAVARLDPTWSCLASHKTPSAPDCSIEHSEEAVDGDSDDEDHDDDREQLLCVRKVSSELDLLSERKLMADDADDLAGHQAAPRESPSLLEPADE